MNLRPPDHDRSARARALPPRPIFGGPGIFARTLLSLFLLCGLSFPLAAQQSVDLAEALDEPTLTFTTGGATAWSPQTAVTHDGVAAAASGAIGHGQESWMETTVTGPGTLTFWWSVSSEANYDFLEFHVNGQLQASISGEVPWQQRTHTLGTGPRTLRWRYLKNSSVDAGSDAGWVDQMKWMPVAMHGEFSYLSNGTSITITGYTGAGGSVVIPDTITGLPVTHINGAAFYGRASLTHVVFPAGLIEIGAAAFHGCTGLTRVTFPAGVRIIGSMAFQGCTSLTDVTFPISLTHIGNMAFNGCTGLTSVSLLSPDLVNVGFHAFASCTSLTVVTMASSRISIEPFAFMDCVDLAGVFFMGDAPNLVPGLPFASNVAPEFKVYHYEGARKFTSPFWGGYPVGSMGSSAGGGLSWALDQPFLSFATGGHVLWFAQSAVTHDGTSAAASGKILHEQESWMETTVAGPGILTFWWCVSSEQNGDRLEFRINGLPQAVAISGQVSWQQRTQILGAGSHKLRWRYYKNSAGTSGADTGWVDQVKWTRFLPPVVETDAGGAQAISTTGVRVRGRVRAGHALTQVFCDYGTDPNFGPSFQSITASPNTLNGDEDLPVIAELTNLLQGVTYYYRFRAINSVGLVAGTTGSFTPAILSGLDRVFPLLPPVSSGLVTVNMNPTGIASGWRFAGEREWRAPGSQAAGLTTGDRLIEFRPVPGYIHPPSEILAVAGGANLPVHRDYYETGTTGSGGLTVSLKPEALAAESVLAAERAQWRLLGGNGGDWKNSGETLTGLIPGQYLVEGKPVAGRITPPPVAVTVTHGATAVIAVTYYQASTPTGTPPVALDFGTVSGDQTAPYAHVGQIRSASGLATGFVVLPRVVATAAHVVFDDGTLSYANDLQWLFQRDREVHEPKPQIPRGSYIYAGYAAQRMAENTPGTSSPQSQHLDVAALYFDEDAGRGGFAGYLASDTVPNEFLTSSALKTLAGYPVDGIDAALAGRMHATPPANFGFAAGHGRTYTTAAIRGMGGMSGGPLCVRHQNGHYYPAAIYLGGSGQTVVRAIDSEVIELFNRAKVSGDGGGNNTGGGITHTGVTAFGSPGEPGAIRVHIEPAAAREAGALWGLTPESPARPSGGQRTGLNAGSYLLDFKAVAGFLPPVRQSVQVNGGQQSQVTFTYVPSSGALEAWRLLHFGTAENAGDAADHADPDGDGQDNLAEFTAGTNPKDAADRFQVLSATRTAGAFTLSVSGKTGRIYRLQRREESGGASWQPLPDPVGPLTEDGVVDLTDHAAAAPRALYRAVVSKP